jgi:tetratricopeptide (TPR) repeat protein
MVMRWLPWLKRVLVLALFVGAVVIVVRLDIPGKVDWLIGKVVHGCDEGIYWVKTRFTGRDERATVKDMAEAAAALQVGDDDLALAWFRTAARHDPRSAVPHVKCGGVHEKKKDYGKAVEAYGKAIEADPEYASAYFARGLLLGELKRYDEAIADFSDYLRLNPRESAGYNNRGAAYLGKGANDKAIANFLQALRFDPNNTQAKSNLALARARSSEQAPIRK